jgi:hypothetical protein
MGKTSGSNQMALATNDAFATEAKPLGKVLKCKRGKTLLKAYLLRIDNDQAIDNEVVKATISGNALTKTSAAVTGLADYGEVKPGSYTFSVTLSANRLRMFKPYTPQTAAVPKQVDFHAKLKIEPLAKLRIVLFDKAGNKISGATWTMTQPVAANGTTGGDGLIEVTVPWNAASGDLDVTLPNPGPKEPAPGPAPVVDPANPAYPLGINAAQFLPAEDPANPPPSPINWTYQISLLSAADNQDGWKARLLNVGFPIDDNTRVTRSVKAYQRMKNKNYAGSGVIADVSGDLKTQHDTV